MASNESENSLQSPPSAQFMVVVEESEASFSSSNPSNQLRSSVNTCRSNNSGQRASQFSKSISQNRSSDDSNRDSSKEELFSKKSTESNHILRVIIEDVLSEKEQSHTRANGLMGNPTSRLFMLRHVGCHFAQQGQYNKAITCFSLLVKEVPQNGINHTLLVIKQQNQGLSYLAHGNPELALANFESALIFLPDIRDPNLWIAIATALQQIRRPQIALQAYHRVLKLVPRFPHLSYIHFQLACLEQCLGYYDKAIRHYKQAMLDNFPNNAYRVKALGRIASCYASKGQRKLALNALETAITFDPTNVMLYHRLSAFHYHQGNLQKMEQTLQRVLRIEPQMWCTHYLLGRLYDIKDQKEKAKTYLLQAMKLSDQLKAEVMCTLGVWAGKGNQPFQALEAFKQAIVIEEDEVAWHNIGVLYYKHQQFQQAIQAFSKVSNSGQNDWNHYKLPEIDPHRQIFTDPPFYQKIKKQMKTVTKGMREKLPVFFEGNSEYQKIAEDFQTFQVKSDQRQGLQFVTSNESQASLFPQSLRGIPRSLPQIMQVQLSEELKRRVEKRGDGTPEIYVRTKEGYVAVCLMALPN